LERPIALPRQNDNAQAPSPDRDDHICVAQPNQTLKLFLRTIIERPHLARNTKRVVLGSWSRSTSYNDSLYQDAVEASKPGPNLRSTYFKALRKLAVLRRSRNGADFFSWLDFVSHVLDGYEGSELILLLQLTPNLTTLHLAQIPYIRKWMVTGEYGLASRVNTIRLGSADKMHEVMLFRLRVLLTLPNLRTLTFVNCSVWGLSRCPPSNLTCLSFQRCWVSPSAFELLIEHISNLEIFKWIGPRYQDRRLSRRGLEQHHDTVIRMLLAFVDRQKSSLRTLRILGDEFGTNAQRLSLKGFNLLEKLAIESRLLDADRLCLSDQLPQSLRYLMIDQCCAQMALRLVALIGARALPNLKEVGFGHVHLDVLSHLHRMEYELAASELRKTCATKGWVLTRIVKDRWTSMTEAAL